MKPNAPTKEELFYAALAGDICGDLELVGRMLTGVENASLEGHDPIEAYHSLQSLLGTFGHRVIRKAADYAESADAFSKAAFIKRYEHSGESPAAPKSQAN